MRGRWRFALVAVLAVLLLGTIAYLGAAYLVYDEVSRTADPNAGRYDAINPSNLVFTDAAGAHDFSRFETNEFSDVRFPSRQAGIQIAAWYMPAGKNALAVVVTHGLRSSRHDPAALVPAAMLHAHGFAVLAIDLRDHGDSTMEDGRFAGGAEEQLDVLGAFDWLVDRGTSPDQIGVFGTSLGAGASLIAAANEPGIHAVWEDSSYADTITRIEEELAQRGYPTFLAPAAPLMGRLVAGDDLSTWSPLKAVQAFDGTALFITHGKDDTATLPHHADDLFKAAKDAGIPVQRWMVDGAGHTEAYWREADEYESRIQEFFTKYLGAPTS